MEDPSSTLPAGSYWLLLQTLWRTGCDAQDEGDAGGFEQMGEWNSCPVADVAFFDKGFVRAWFFTAKDGALRKKRKKSLGVNELAVAFGKGQSSGLEQEIVALAVFGPNGKMDEAGRRNSSVAPLDRNALHWLLEQRDSSRRTELQAIVKYVPPRGEREAVLRFDWRAQVCSFELRSSMAPLKAASSLSVVPPYQRLATHAPALVHSYKEKHVPASAVKECAAICQALAARLLPDLPRDQVRVCADFKLLGGDRVVLAWASVPSANAVFPGTDFPASMPSKALPAVAHAPRAAAGAKGGKGTSSPSPPRGGGTPRETPRGTPRASDVELVFDSKHDVDPYLLLPQPKRRNNADGGAQDGRAASAGAGGGGATPRGGGGLSARPATVTGGVTRHSSGRSGGSGGSEQAESMRRVPGLGLMCSKYFVCRGCGQAELRSLAVQPERDVQHARAPEVLKGQGLDEFMNGGGGGALSYGNWSRPTSATISATARLASPRLRVNAADGWHRAAMCKECAERMRREEQEEAEAAEERRRVEEEKAAIRRSMTSKDLSPGRRASSPLRPPQRLSAASPSEGHPSTSDGDGGQPANAPVGSPSGWPNGRGAADDRPFERNAAAALSPPAPGEVPSQSVLAAAAEYVRTHNQRPPKWLRPYLNDVDASLSAALRPATS